MNRIVLAALAALALTTGSALACGDGTVCTVADPTGTPLNVRAVPDGKVIASLPNGTEVDVIEHREDGDGHWALVAPYETSWGIVYADYLKCDKQDDMGQMCTVADPSGTPLNVRDDAGGEVIGTWGNGTIVRPYDTIHSGGKTWLAVDRYAEDNALGWVWGEYVTCEDEEYEM